MKLLEQKCLRNKISTFLTRFRADNPRVIKKQIQVYADEKEMKEMSLCHEKAITLLEEFIQGIASFGTKRALDVAAGDGQASRDLLQNFFESIDCFDQCPNALKKLELLQERIYKIEKVDQATM